MLSRQVTFLLLVLCFWGFSLASVAADATPSVTPTAAPVAKVAPPRWKKPGYNSSTPARDSFLLDLAPQVTSPDGAIVTFSKVSGPEWLTVSPAGQVGGVPGDGDLDTNTFVIAAKNDGGAAQIKLAVKVQFKNHPPKFDDTALRFTVKERETFHVNLNQSRFVQDPDSKDQHSFELGGNKRDWIQLSKTGDLTISPNFAQIGEYSFAIQVSDGTESTLGTMQVLVERSPRAPQWKQPKWEFTTRARQPIHETMKGKVVDPDGVPLIYEKKSGPAWVKVALDGTITGSPHDNDVGTGVMVVTAKNDVASADTEVSIKVLFSRQAPFFFSHNVTLPRGKSDEPYTAQLGSYAVDPAPPHTLKFFMVSGPNWIRVLEKGVLESTRTVKEVGKFPLVIRAVNSVGQTVEADFTLQIDHKNRPPKMDKNPYPLPAMTVGELVTMDLKGMVTDPDNDTITFKHLQGPEWLAVAKTGEITGVPSDPDLGNYEMVVEVSDGRESIKCKFTGTVVAKKKRAIH